MKHHIGFTLIELTLIIAIIASTAMMIIPIVESTSKGISVESEAYRLQSFLYDIRRDAVRTGKEHKIYFNPDSNTFSFSIGNNDEKKSELMLHLNSKIRMKNINSDGYFVSFINKGIASNSAVIELINRRNKSFSVEIISPSGNIIVRHNN